MLPTADQPWPPPAFAAIAEDIRLADVWYSGTADDLAAFYAAQSVTSTRRKRGFWGRERSGQQVKVGKRVHLPTSAAIASASADLLFGETPALTTEHDASTARLNEYDLGSTLLEGAELASGLGGVYLRPVWDRSITDRPMLTVMDPDSAVPEFRWGRLVAVTFWSEIDRTDSKIVRHLERYEAGLILHGVYVGNDMQLGSRVDLRSFEATKNLDAVESDGVLNLTKFGVGTLAAAYVPNVRPNRRRRKHPIGRHMGRADTSGLESLMSAIDETWSSLMRDIDLGKRRIIVPDEYLDHYGRGQGATFDGDREIFAPLDFQPREGATGIDTVDFDIRATDHLRTATELFAQLTSQVGYSVTSLGQGQDNGPQKTATEVDSENSLSGRTTSRKRRYWGEALVDMCEVMLKLDRGVFSTQVEPDRPTVEWPDASEGRMRDTAETLNLIQMAGAASTETRVRMLNPAWTDADIDAEVGRIAAESGNPVDDPTGFLS